MKDFEFQDRRREIWTDNQDLERIEKVRRCLYCGAKEDGHNLSEDMRYYGYSEHPFQYPSAAEIEDWSAKWGSH